MGQQEVLTVHAFFRPVMYLTLRSHGSELDVTSHLSEKQDQ